MGLDQDLYALYDNGVECCIEMYRKNYLLRSCIRTLVPSYMDNGDTIMSREDIYNVMHALEQWRRDGNGPTVDTPDCWYKQLLSFDNAESPWTFEEQQEQALTSLRKALSHGTIRFRYWESY